MINNWTIVSFIAICLLLCGFIAFLLISRARKKIEVAGLYSKIDRDIVTSTT